MVVEMKLESLANELFLDLFEYLTAIDLFHIFHGLNSRFNLLLFKYFQGYNLDLRSTSKQDCNYFIRLYLPLIINQIESFYLSNNDETPEQIDIFFTYDYPLRQFTNLQSFSVSHLRSEQMLFKIISQLSRLPLLTCLNFIECHFRFSQEETQYILESVLSLSKLKQCYLGVDLGTFRLCLPASSIVSSPLEQLRLVGSTNLRELTCLFRHAPHLQYLRLIFNDCSTKEELLNIVSSMISLNILVRDSLFTMTNILKNMPNLCYLKIETQLTVLDGHEWEYIISYHLPKLKVFKLKMLLIVNNNINKKQRVDELVNSFRSHFWLHERQWFIRCHWNIIHDGNSIYLYTLPYAFGNCDSFICTTSQSTCYNQDDHYSYDSVRSLNYNDVLMKHFGSHHICFNSIRYLTISSPINDSFWSCIPRLNQLISLNISLISFDDRSKLQMLLNRAPHLYSLILINRVIIEKLLSVSIRRLDFQNNNLSTDKQWFDNEQCIQLSRSSLGIQCEVLLIRVKYSIDILTLVNNMINLRALNVECADDEWCSKSLEEDDLVKRLECVLPSSCTISRHAYFEEIIRLWIQR